MKSYPEFTRLTFKLASINLIILSALLHLYSPAFSQSTFEYVYSSPLDEISRSLFEDNEGNIFFAVESFKYGLIIKLNQNGHFLDSIHIENPNGTCNIGEIIPIDDSHFIALGHWATDTSAEFWYIKFDNELNVVDDKKLDSEGWIVSDIRHIINHNNNIVFVAAYENDAHDWWVCMYEITSDGSVVRKVFFDQKFPFTQAFTLLENKFDNTYKVFTRYPLPTRNAESYSILDSNFNVLSQGSFGSNIFTHNTAKWINDTTYLLTGKNLILPDEEWDAGILKVNINDSILSSAYFGVQDTVEWPGLFKSLDFISTSNIFFAGSYNSFWYPDQNQPSWIMLNILDENINLKTQQFYGGDAYYVVNAVIATQDSGCVMACSFYDYKLPFSEFDVYILKVNKDGLLVSVPDNPVMAGTQCKIYPNPGKDVIHIDTEIEGLYVEFFDVYGRKEIASELATGSNPVYIGKLAAGMYLYRICDGKNRIVLTGKCMKATR